MRLLFVGTPKVAADTLKQLLTDPEFSRFEIAAVLTREDAPIGRKRIVTPSDVATTGLTYGIPVIKANKVDDAVIASIHSHGVDAAVVIAYGSLIGKKALDSLPLGWFNLHYSLLPKYRGAAPVQWALINGERETGVTLFKLDQGMDTGPIMSSVSCVVEPNDNAFTLLERLRLLGVSLLSEQLPLLESGIAKLTPQASEALSTAPKLTRGDGAIDWGLTSRQVVNLIRGVNPEPGAFSSFQGTVVKVLEALEVADHGETDEQRKLNAPGMFSNHRGKVLVRCGEGLLELVSVQPAGKSAMSASSWLAGLSNRYESHQLFFEELTVA